MKAFIVCLACAFLAAASAASGAHVPCASTDTQQAHSKSPSSFAPRAGGTKRRVYGAPIQGKILKTRPKKKQVSPSGKPPG